MCCSVLQSTATHCNTCAEHMIRPDTFKTHAQDTDTAKKKAHCAYTRGYTGLFCIHVWLFRRGIGGSPSAQGLECVECASGSRQACVTLRTLTHVCLYSHDKVDVMCLFVEEYSHMCACVTVMRVEAHMFSCVSLLRSTHTCVPLLSCGEVRD